MRELEPWEQSKISPPEKLGAQSKDLVDTRWAPTRKEVEGVKTVKSRLVDRGYQDPDLASAMRILPVA